MTKTYLHPFAFGETNIMPLDFKTFSVRKRLPGWRQCQDPKPPFITFGADAWNCAKCNGEKDFSLPVNADDQFQFQFQFDDGVNEDASNPVFGWRDAGTGEDAFYISGRILDCNCNEILDGIETILVNVDQFASSYGVAYDSTSGSFQWLNLDMGLIPEDLCCFMLEITYYTLVDNVPTESQIITAGPFRRNDVSGCNCPIDEDKTVLICGSYKKADCWGRRYDVAFGDSLFTDCIRVEGNIVRLGTSTEFAYDGEVLVKTVQKARYRLELAGMPPMIAEWVSNILASNDTLTIGDYSISRANGDTVGSFDKLLDNVQMFHGNVEFSIVCEIENFGCN